MVLDNQIRLYSSIQKITRNASVKGKQGYRLQDNIYLALHWVSPPMITLLK